MNRRSFVRLIGASALPLLTTGCMAAAAQARTRTAAPPGRPMAGRWTIAVLPDTQRYSLLYPEVFAKQTEWIVAQRAARDIRFVLHEGDITDRNSHPEWLNARHAMDVLRRARIPYVMVPGNHDLGQWGSTFDRRSFFSDYFTSADCFGAKKWGAFEPRRLENTWHTFDTPWGPFLIVALEFFPRDAVVAWANDIVAARPDHQAVLLTHAYLYSDDTRYDRTARAAAQKWGADSYAIKDDPAGTNDGEQLWQKLVSRHRNFLLTLNGHVLNDGTGYLASVGAHGQTVHQLLTNYQTGVKGTGEPGGGGFIRLLEFQPDGKTIRVSAYSPWLDQWRTEPDQQFTLALAAPVVLAGTTP